MSSSSTSPSQAHATAPSSRPQLTPPRALAQRKPISRTAKPLSRITTSSTPNLRAQYSNSNNAPPLPSLQRKASQAALTPNTLAAVPDASESYALATLNTSPPRSNKMPPPLTPRAGAAVGGDFAVGDTVEVPGNMQGTVRFIGSVQGKRGVFAGVELHQDFASRGKNNGDVDGVTYFSTTIPGAGIFLPLTKAVKRESPPNSASSYTMTPLSTGGLKAGTQNSTNHTPVTASLPQFSKSAGPGRTTSPVGKKPRPSLSRPESPLRKMQMTPAARPSLGNPPARSTPRLGSPTHNKLSKSLHGPTTPGDPAKRGMLQPQRNASMGPRSASALSGISAGFTTDDETTLVGSNGFRGGDASRSGSAMKFRVPSRQGFSQSQEVDRLRAELAHRDKQIQEQSAMLADMEISLTEVQNLMEQADVPLPARKDSLDDKDTVHLRALVREKNEKIAMLTAEFDTHRADFRSTIDTLELASTETERVYEKRIEELMQDIQQIHERTSDVDAVATQLRQLEELVQELEEGLEDARRGEAEARGEVEFLRGEVERTRAELRREREKAAGGANSTNGGANGDNSALFKNLEQKEDEIRGLKAIIHSLSRDSVPSDADKTPTNAEDGIAREKLEREVAELRALLGTKNSREEELEHEIETLRRGSAATLKGSVPDSENTLVTASDREARSPHQSKPKTHKRMRTLETMAESDAMSSITENSTLWCELCEASGHDILACTNMFGTQTGQKVDTLPKPMNDGGDLAPISENSQYKIAPLSPRPPPESKPPPVGGSANSAKTLPKPNLMDAGPMAGKESGVIDPNAWCALCEKDGHNSVDCPFEDAF